MVLIMLTSLTDMGHIAITDTSLTDIDPMAIIDIDLTEISVGVAIITGVVIGAAMLAIITGAEVMMEAETDILAVGGKAGEEVMAADTADDNYCYGVR
jgi:hypothetical protein